MPRPFLSSSFAYQCIALYSYVMAAIQKCVADEVMGIGQKVCALMGNAILQTLQHGENTTELVIQKTQRVISVNALGQQKAVHSLVQSGLIVVQG